MTRTLVLTVVAVVLTTLAAIGDADAKRLGGGRSLGAQRQSIAPPASSSGPAANPVMPAQPGVAGAAPANPTAGGGSRWLGPIAGIAAGLGLAALLSHFGLPEGFGSVLLLGLLAIGGVLVFRMLTARRAPSAAIPYARAPAGYGPATAPARVEPVLLPAQPAAPSTPFAGTLPADFDATGFLREAKLQFRRLQAAWDAGDRKALADVMTPAMVAEILHDLDERGPHQTEDRNRCARRRNARCDDRCRGALGLGSLYRHRARRRRAADAARRDLEPVEAGRRLDRMASRRNPPDRLTGSA